MALGLLTERDVLLEDRCCRGAVAGIWHGHLHTYADTMIPW
jgi:hypothetical protein